MTASVLRQVALACLLAAASAARPAPVLGAAVADTPSTRAKALEASEASPAAQRRLRVQRCTTIGCLYAAALLNGLARRSLGVAVPALLDGGVMSKEETEEITALGYRFYAVGKLLAAPLVLRLGNKGTLVLQLAMISSCCAAFVAPFASRRVQVACWCMLRIFTAMAFPSLVAFVRNWFPRNAYGRVWGFLNSGFQSGYFLASLGYGPLVARGALGWRTPFEVVAALGAAHTLACVGLLQNKPRPHARALF